MARKIFKSRKYLGKYSASRQFWKQTTKPSTVLTINRWDLSRIRRQIYALSETFYSQVMRLLRKKIYHGPTGKKTSQLLVWQGEFNRILLSSTSRILYASVAGVNGFCRNATPESKNSW